MRAENQTQEKKHKSIKLLPEATLPSEAANDVFSGNPFVALADNDCEIHVDFKAGSGAAVFC